MHESNFHVARFSYGSNTRDTVGRISRSQADFDVVATSASSKMLAATASRWILATTASYRPCRPQFQHSSPSSGPQILAVTVGTSSWRASLTVGNASMDYTNTAAATTFFFTTDGMTFVPPFNCYINNKSQCRTCWGVVPQVPRVAGYGSKVWI
jgi:hypothetical protein